METTPTKTDLEHLNLLVIFHRLGAGLGVLAMGFLALHYLLMTSVLGPEFQKASNHPMPFDPTNIFLAFYVFMGGMTVVAMVLHLYTAHLIKHRKGRTFTQIVAGLSCLNMPLGTALGVFTFVVLSRPSVRQLYGIE